MESIKRIVYIILPLILLACTNSAQNNVSGHSADFDKDSISNNDSIPVKISKFRFYDLFKLQGSEPYEGDMCVTETRQGDTLTISATLPQEYSIKLVRLDDYWHFTNEFFMDRKDRVTAMSEPQATRNDRFIRNDTIFDYMQQGDYLDVDNFLFIKTDSILKVYHKKSPRFICNADSILMEIKKLPKSNNNLFVKYYVTRDETSCTLKSMDDKEVYNYDYLESQIKGAYFGWITDDNPYIKINEYWLHYLNTEK